MQKNNEEQQRQRIVKATATLSVTNKLALLNLCQINESPPSYIDPTIWKQLEKAELKKEGELLLTSFGKKVLISILETYLAELRSSKKK